MRNAINTAVYKVLLAIVILSMIFGFKDLVLHNTAVSSMFATLMGAFPFSKQILDIVKTCMKCSKDIPLITSAGIITDILKLLLMATIQPPILGILQTIFLPMTDIIKNQILSTPGNYGMNQAELQEAYMNTPGYKLKSMLLKVIASPCIALLTANIINKLMNDKIFGTVGVVIVIAVLLLILIISLKFLSNLSWEAVIVWRLYVTIFSPLITTIVTTFACFGIYVYIAGDIQYPAVVLFVSLIIFLAIMESAGSMIKRAIVGSGR